MDEKEEQADKWYTKYDFDTVRVYEWKCPAENGVPLITMPNIPKPLNGINPRGLMGEEEWDKLRMNCYRDSKYTCEICKAKLDDRSIQLHELYSYDFKAGVGKFERYISICLLCHNAIHSGRTLSLYRRGNPIFTKNYVLEVSEHCFKLVNQYNRDNKEELRVFNVYLEYLRMASLNKEMGELIRKYDIRFYRWPRSTGFWKRWHMVWKGKSYYTPYANGAERLADMKERNKTDRLRMMEKE